MGYAGNPEPTHHIPTAISDHINKVNYIISYSYIHIYVYSIINNKRVTYHDRQVYKLVNCKTTN